MKRVLLPLLIVLILAGVGLYLQRRVAPQSSRVALWLPSSTILLEDMPDLHRTAERWPDTELSQIIDEPAMQAFLERPLGDFPHHSDVDQAFARLGRIDPIHFFLAVTDWSGAGAPATIAGLYFVGSRQDMDGLVDQLRKRVEQTWPEGKSDIEKYGSGDIETFTTPNFSAGLAYSGQWIFISTDTALLKSTLDRFQGQLDPNSLANLPLFQNCLQHLPPASDNYCFIRPELLADKAGSFALMVNPNADSHSGDSLKAIQAVGLSFKLDGEVMRDAAYVVKAQQVDETPLARDVLKLSTPDTIIAVSDRVASLGNAQMPDPKADPSGLLSLIASYLQVFSSQGLGAQQLAQAFGPESGFVLDWPSSSMIPTPLGMLDVRQPVLARKFLDTLTTLPLAAGVEFTHQDIDGIAFYNLPLTGIGIFPIQFTLGLTANCVIGAVSMDGVKQGVLRWKMHGPGVDSSDAYKKAISLVDEPTSSFTYIDTKAIFGRIYGLFRGVASMGFVPHLADYVDIGKLPAPETFTRHLTPIVASGSVRDGGLLMESAGPVTTTEAGLVAAIGVGAAALPYVEQQMKGQSVSLPSIPGFGSKSPANPQSPSTSPLFQGGSTWHLASPPQLSPAIPSPAASPSPGAP